MNEQVPAILLESVSKAFRSGDRPLTVLDQINLTVNAGEFVAVMGASGSGKTTLLNLMGGLLTADSGRVVVEGEDLGTKSDNQLTILRRERVGFVFQMYNLVGSLTVEQNILLPKLAGGKPLKAEDRLLFDELVCKIGLQDRLNHKPAELSGGEQQRAAVARALISRPALVFADEPTGNLDSQNTNNLGKLFRSLHQSDGAAFVLVTHDPAVASWADRLLILRDGKILDDRKTSDFPSSGELAAYYQRMVSTPPTL